MSAVSFAAGIILPQLGWRALFSICGTLAVATAGLTYLSLPSPTLAPFHTTAVPPSTPSAPLPRTRSRVPTDASQHSASPSLFVSDVLNINVVCIIIASFCYNFLRASIADWSALLLIENYSFTVLEANTINLQFSIAGLVLPFIRAS